MIIMHKHSEPFVIFPMREIYVRYEVDAYVSKISVDFIQEFKENRVI